jgi:hypothetical protein
VVEDFDFDLLDQIGWVRSRFVTKRETHHSWTRDGIFPNIELYLQRQLREESELVELSVGNLVGSNLGF